jgi:putative inorganic carbon (hco3(-)) transporter
MSRSATYGLVIAASALAVGLLVAWLVSGGITQETVLIVAGPFLVLLAHLATSRFEWFVWTVLLVRPSLDAVTIDGGLGPGAMLAAFFLVVASVWLVVQRRSGQWQPLCLASRAMLVFAGAVGLSVITSTLHTVSGVAALEILAGISMFLVLEQLLAGRTDRLKRLVAAVLIGAVTPAAVGLYQWAVGAGDAHRTETARVHGTFVHPNPYATYLVLILVLALSTSFVTRGRLRIVLLVFTAVVALLIVATLNRAGWIGLVVALGYLGARRSPWILAAILAAVAASTVFVPPVADRIADLSAEKNLPEGVPQNSFEWRLQYWGDLLPMADQSPVTGIGPQVVMNTRPEGLEPHNVLVQAYVELGVVGFAALVGMIVAIGVTAARRRRYAVGRLQTTYANAAVAALLSVFVLVPSENLLNATMTWWYLAACATWGFSSSARARNLPDPDAARAPARGAVLAAVADGGPTVSAS